VKEPFPPFTAIELAKTRASRTCACRSCAAGKICSMVAAPNDAYVGKRERSCGTTSISSSRPAIG
jgi:hypothetical protein